MAAIALTIAGSDSGGGAGIQADLKTFSALGVYGCSVITAITAQNTQAVTAVHPVPDDIVAAQIDAVLSDLDVAAIKIGMLGSPSLIETVANALQGFPGPVVLDPVMVSKSGAVLLPDDAITALKTHLLPRAELITPNLPEAAKLLGDTQADGPDAVRVQAQALQEAGARAVLMKGGHAEGETCSDWLYQGAGAQKLDAPRIQTANTHGTGCSYSSAITACRAKGQTLDEAVRNAHAWLHTAIAQADALQVGRGHGPVHHFHAVWA